MEHRRPSLDGQRFGRLTVIGPSPRKTKQGAAKWLCRCECGRTSEPSTNALRSGNSTSCGCVRESKLAALRQSFHHQCHTSEYRIWTLIRQRCRNPKSPNYKNYGGRGITVCPEWDDFTVFLRDMGTRPSASHSIDRIDNNGPYAPENCRWATTHEQNTNKRNTVRVDGEYTVGELAERAGINASTLYYRLRRGLSVSDAISRPLHARHPNLPRPSER